MAAPVQRRREALERLMQAEEKYARTKEKIQRVRADLTLNKERQPRLRKARDNASAAHDEAAAATQARERRHSEEVAKLRAAEANELSARQAFEDAERTQQELSSLKALASESLQQNEDEAKRLRSTLPELEDELNEAEIALENCRGEAKAAKMSTNASGHADHLHKRGAVASAEDPLAKRARTEPMILPLKTWTTGKIFSPLVGDFVRGYPHASNPDYSQQFILHLDTGNSGPTIISRTAFDFLGLGQSSTLLGHVNIEGVHGQPKKCPVYEIKYTIDTVNLLKPGITYQRTAKAAVLKSGMNPCTEGYYDLLLCAEDCRKWSERSTDEKKLRIEILDQPPSNLYDNTPLQMKCPFNTWPPGQQQLQRQVTSDEKLLGVPQDAQQPNPFGMFGSDPFAAFFPPASSSHPSSGSRPPPSSNHHVDALLDSLRSRPPAAGSRHNALFNRGPAFVAAC